MDVSYRKVASLEEVAAVACEAVPPGNYVINFFTAFHITLKQLQATPLRDVESDARDWSSPNCPQHLYFNHGQYIKGGVEYIGEELKRKPSSNRALYSLINQSDVINSEDNPIPSFMIFQTTLKEGCLYCTVYFRALEVSKFLRINLEEIRQNILQLKSVSVSFDSVKVLIIGFRAHHTIGFNPLVKPEIDQLSSLDILNILETDKLKMRSLLMEKSDATTVIDTTSLKSMLECIQKRDLHFPNQSRLISLLEEAVFKSEELMGLRKLHSHSEEVTELTARLSNVLKELSQEF
ncbi:hypothetical protein EQG41_01090 [Billgrantia azerbaijanica]|nr:hypothetical protein EQG41_01090 [Halomonas azerbaijanica]